MIKRSKSLIDMDRACQTTGGRDEASAYTYAEMEYPVFFKMERCIQIINSLPESVIWNACFCLFVLMNLTMRASGIFADMNKNVIEPVILISSFVLIDVPYLIHVIVLVLNDINNKRRGASVNFFRVEYLIDLLIIPSELWLLILMFHQVDLRVVESIVFLLAALRLHRPVSYLGSLNDYTLKGSIIGTTLKYIYISAVMRIIFAAILTYLDHYSVTSVRMEFVEHFFLFWHSWHATDKMFIPMGTEYYPKNDFLRLWYIVVMISGSLVIMGICVAALTLIIGLYMRPEEMFRRRFSLIMKDVIETKIPQQLREKIERFYVMFWHKQKAVSKSQLLPTYPPCLVSDVRSNIYFRAQQKCRLLSNLSNHFLSEVAKYMETIRYIPGDVIIQRNTNKSTMVFITYGDVEILSAEDDDTPLLRFTRGSIINPCGPAVEIACTRAHVAVRAATFCTAHVLKSTDLWRVAVKYGRRNVQNYLMRLAVQNHFDCIKDHYKYRPHPAYKYKSNIIQLKKSLLELKEARLPDGRPYLEKSEYFLNIAGCYLMRNLSNLANTIESDPICLRGTFPCILQPNSSLLVVWNTFVAILTLFITFYHPYRLIFIRTVSMEYRFFDYIVSFIYAVDIVVHLSTGTKVEEGVPLTFAETSTHQMHSFWFTIHVLSSLPIFELVGNGRFAGLNKLCKIPVIFRMLRYFEGLYVYHSHAIRFCSYCLLIVIIAFLLASLNQGFLCFGFNHCQVIDYTQEPYWTMGALDNDMTNIRKRLIFGIYWATSMMSFTTHKTVEITHKIFEIKVMIWLVLELVLIVRILVEATYSATIIVADRMGDQYKMVITSVTNFLVKNDVNPVLRQRFINYLQLCWYTDKAYAITNDKSSILFDLPTHVHQDILTMQRSKFMLSVPFIKYLPNEMLKEISSRARLFYVAVNEILLNTGDMTDEIYIVKQGMCEILDPITKKRARLLQPKGVFGDCECLLRLPAYYTVRAITTVRVYTIPRKILTKAMALPKISDAINYVKRLPEYQDLLISREPFAKYEPPPLPPNRTFFPLPRKHQSDYDYLYPFQRLGFMSILRYVFPRFTIRPDGSYLKHYEWFRAFCAIITAFIYPLYTLLELQWSYFYTLAWLLDLAAYCDIVQRMLVGYFNEHGILVYHPAITAAHYIRGAFIVDLAGCFPLESLDYVRTTIYFENNAYCQPATWQYLMYNRLLQLYRVPGALEFLDEQLERKDIILMIKAFPLIVSLLSLITSIVLEYSLEKWKPISGGWRLTLKSGSFDNWITRNRDGVRYNITETPFSAILTTFYWVVYETTSTGFNIFQPGSLDVMTVLIVGMLLSMVIITYYAVRVISIRSNVNQELASFQENMTDMVRFMKKEKLSKSLQREVLSYYEYMWKKMGGTSKRAVLKLCDQITLRTDAILDIYGYTFDKCPLLYKCDLSLLRVIGRAVDSVYFREGMTIIEPRDVISELYLVDYGTVEAREDIHDYKVYTKLPRGSAFGNLENSASDLSKTEFVAITNVHLLKINTETFYRILQDFPSTKAHLVEILPEGENFIISHEESLHSVRMATSEVLTSAMDTKQSVLNKKEAFQYLLFHIVGHRKCIQIFLITISMLCVYGDIYNAGFKDNRLNLLYILYTLDICFIFKIIRKFVLSRYIDQNNYIWAELIYLMRQQKYYSLEFKYDIISVIPFEILSFLSESPWDIFPFLRLNRLIRVSTAYNCLKRYHENLYINLTMSTAASVFIWFTLFVHTSACIWHHLGVLQDQVLPNSSWKYANDGKYLCDGEYLCSLYFIVTTFTQNGTGDILPKQKIEVAFVCILMILSTIIFLIYVGEFSNIIQYRSFRYYSFYYKYLELQAFLRKSRVAKNLINIVEDYSLHLWRESRGKQIPYFIESAPRSLRLHVMSAAYMHHFLAHPILQECEPAFLRQLVGHLQLLTYNEGMHVVKEDQITNSMYFIHKGLVVEIDEDFDEKGRVFSEGQHFGTEQGFKTGLPYEVSYKTVIKSQVLTLTLDNWEYLLKHYPQSRYFIYKDEDFKPLNNKNTNKAEPMHIFDKDSYLNPSSATYGFSEPTTSVTQDKSTLTKEKPLALISEGSTGVKLETTADTKTISTEDPEKKDKVYTSTEKQFIEPLKNEPRTILRKVEGETEVYEPTPQTTAKSEKSEPLMDEVLTAITDEENLPVLDNDVLSTSDTAIDTIKIATDTPSTAMSYLTTPAMVTSTIITAIAKSLTEVLATFTAESESEAEGVVLKTVLKTAENESLQVSREDLEKLTNSLQKLENVSTEILEKATTSTAIDDKVHSKLVSALTQSLTGAITSFTTANNANETAHNTNAIQSLNDTGQFDTVETGEMQPKTLKVSTVSVDGTVAERKSDNTFNNNKLEDNILNEIESPIKITITTPSDKNLEKEFITEGSSSPYKIDDAAQSDTKLILSIESPTKIVIKEASEEDLSEGKKGLKGSPDYDTNTLTEASRPLYEIESTAPNYIQSEQNRISSVTLTATSAHKIPSEFEFGEIGLSQLQLKIKEERASFEEFLKEELSTDVDTEKKRTSQSKLSTEVKIAALSEEKTISGVNTDQTTASTSNEETVSKTLNEKDSEAPEQNILNETEGIAGPSIIPKKKEN